MTARNLAGTSGAFTSARLYTMIQANTASDIISAIPAAIAQNTTLLLGIWASGGQAGVTNEITALTAAAKQYGTALAGLVAGLSVGSEDLYRETPTGIENQSGVGASPSDIVSYIQQVKTALTGTALSDVSIGHVDTWNAWTNTSNNAVIGACDWLGVDEYSYFQNTESNGIGDAYTLFWTAYDAVEAVSGGKPVWITETGWPVSANKSENLAVASVANAKTYWDEVGCLSAFGKVNTWWYVLQDNAPAVQDPSFGVVGSSTSDATLSTTPLYDLSCENLSLPASLLSSTSTAASSTSTGTGSAGSATTPTGSSQSSATKSGSSASASGSPKSSAGTMIESSSFFALFMVVIAGLF